MEFDKRDEMLRYATYFVANQTTIRSVAIYFGVSKTHVHNILTRMQKIKFLQQEEQNLVEQVRELLDKNKRERHIRGGNATRKKYMKL